MRHIKKLQKSVISQKREYQNFVMTKNHLRSDQSESGRGKSKAYGGKHQKSKTTRLKAECVKNGKDEMFFVLSRKSKQKPQFSATVLKITPFRVLFQLYALQINDIFLQ